MLLEAEVEHTMEVEQLFAVDIVPSTVASSLAVLTGQLVELLLIVRQIHSMQSKVMDIVPIDWVDSVQVFASMVVDLFERILVLVV